LAKIARSALHRIKRSSELIVAAAGGAEAVIDI